MKKKIKKITKIINKMMINKRIQIKMKKCCQKNI